MADTKVKNIARVDVIEEAAGTEKALVEVAGILKRLPIDQIGGGGGGGTGAGADILVLTEADTSITETPQMLTGTVTTDLSYEELIEALASKPVNISIGINFDQDGALGQSFVNCSTLVVMDDQEYIDEIKSMFGITAELETLIEAVAFPCFEASGNGTGPVFSTLMMALYEDDGQINCAIMLIVGREEH